MLSRIYHAVKGRLAIINELYEPTLNEYYAAINSLPVSDLRGDIKKHFFFAGGLIADMFDPNNHLFVGALDGFNKEKLINIWNSIMIWSLVEDLGRIDRGTSEDEIKNTFCRLFSVSERHIDEMQKQMNTSSDKVRFLYSLICVYLDYQKFFETNYKVFFQLFAPHYDNRNNKQYN